MRTIRFILKQKGKTIFSAAPSMSVFDALQLMAERDIGALPVLDKGRLVGIFSERDYARKVVLMGRSSKKTKVSEIMSTHLVIISPTKSCEQGLALMTEKHVRHLPVLHDSKMIGFISIGDLVKSIIEEQQQVIDKLEQHIFETRGLS